MIRIPLFWSYSISRLISDERTTTTRISDARSTPREREREGWLFDMTASVSASRALFVFETKQRRTHHSSAEEEWGIYVLSSNTQAQVMIAIEGGSSDDLFIHRVSPESRCRADPTRRGTRKSYLSASSLVFVLLWLGTARLGHKYSKGERRVRIRSGYGEKVSSRDR